jgi:hypothetical protein
MIEIRILSALKHEITEQQIREVLADQCSTKAFELHEDSEGDPQEMLVGYTQTNVLIEIAVKYTDERDQVFHANRVSAEYRKLYEEAG